MVMKRGLGPLLGTAVAHIAGYTAVLGWNALVARRVGVEVYGAFSLALTIALVAQVVMSCGAPQAIVKFASVEATSWPRVIRMWGYGIPTVIAVLCLALAALFGGTGTRGAELTWSWLWVLICGYALAVVASSAALHQSRGRPALGTWFGIALVPSGALASIWLLTGSESDTNSLIRAYTLAALVVAVASFASTARGRESGPEQQRVRFQSFLVFGITSLGMGLVYLVLSYVDRIMLGSLSTMYEVGIYSIPSRLARMLYFVLYLFPPLVGPVFARHLLSDRPAPALAIYRSSSRVIFMFSAPIMLFLTLEPDYAVTLLGGSDYLAGATALRTLAIGAFLAAGAGNLSLMLQMGGRERAVLAFSGVALVLNLVLNVLLIPEYGASGAAVGTAVSLGIARLGEGILCWQSWRCVPPLLADRLPLSILIAIVLVHVSLSRSAEGAGIFIIGAGYLVLLGVMRPLTTIRGLIEAVGDEGA